MFNERDRRCAAVLPIQVMTTGPLPTPSKRKSGRFNMPRVMKKFPATVMVFGVVSSEGHIMPPHIFEVGLKVNTKVYVDVLESVVIPGAIRWPEADPGCSSRTQCRPTSLKRPRLGFRRSATTLYPSLTSPTPRPEPAGLLRLVICQEHHHHDLPQHQSQSDRCHPPSSRWRLWKKHTPSSRSVSRRWLRLKVATLNRCQLYYIIKLSELIFLIKVLK